MDRPKKSVFGFGAVLTAAAQIMFGAFIDSPSHVPKRKNIRYKPKHYVSYNKARASQRVRKTNRNRVSRLTRRKHKRAA